MPPPATAMLTSLRLALAAELEAQLGFRFIPGRFDPPMPRRLGGVFPVMEAEFGDDVGVEQIQIVVRVAEGFKEVRDQEKPFDPTTLEKLASDLRWHLQDNAVLLGGSWYFRVTNVEYDMETQAFDATVTAFASNVFNPL